MPDNHEPHRVAVVAASPGSGLKPQFTGLMQTVLPAIFIALVVHVFMAQAMRVQGSSMEPGLSSDQRVIVEKVSYQLHGPQRGDIVVVRMSDQGDELLIKRVIALAGETVEIAGGRVYVNGRLLDEPYVAEDTPGSHKWVVEPLHVFVMGDNRHASNDSRRFGTVHRDQILGRALIRYWPPNRMGFIE